MPPSPDSHIARRARHFARALRWYTRGAFCRPRTLLVELNWRLGDEIMALPVVDALRARYPDATLHVLSNYPDLFNDRPGINAVNPPDPDPDRHLLLRGAPRQVYRLAAYAANAGVPLPTIRPRLHYGDWQSPILDRVPEGAGPLVALAPGASWPIKRWPAERWNALAAAVEADGCRVCVLGQTGEAIARGLDLTGQTGIRDAASLLHAADLAVCCDSGLMHLALAADTPAIGLFGPTDPDFLIRDEPDFTPLRSTAPCHGFWNHAKTVGAPGVCPDGHHSCLESITIDQVHTAVRARLASPAGARR